MTVEIIIVFVALILMLAALIWDKQRPGMVLFTMTVVFLCFGIITPKEMLDENRDRVDRYLTSQAEYIKQTTYTRISDDDGPSVYLAYAEKFKSKIAQDLMQREGADLVFVLDMRLRQGSIRSTKDSCIDCSRVAKLIAEDGGGHLNASGFQISDEMFLKGFSYIGEKLSEQIDGWKGLPRYDASENEDGDEE